MTRTDLWAPPRPQPTYDAWLTDEQIEDTMRRAFTPHRCTVRFGGGGAGTASRKLALRIIVATGNGDKEFVVEGVPVDFLRQATELRLYLDDVRMHLGQRGVAFTSGVRATAIGQGAR